MEIYFSDLERVKGEIIKAKGTDYMIQEVSLEILYYNIMGENTMTYRQSGNTVLSKIKVTYNFQISIKLNFFCRSHQFAFIHNLFSSLHK